MFEAYAPIGSPARPFKPADEPVVLKDPVVKAIAEKHKATPAQVSTQHFFITTINFSDLQMNFPLGVYFILVASRNGGCCKVCESKENL